MSQSYRYFNTFLRHKELIRELIKVQIYNSEDIMQYLINNHIYTIQTI
jgi:hypothetical protein